MDFKAETYVPCKVFSEYMRLGGYRNGRLKIFSSIGLDFVLHGKVGKGEIINKC